MLVETFFSVRNKIIHRAYIRTQFAIWPLSYNVDQMIYFFAYLNHIRLKSS